MVSRRGLRAAALLLPAVVFSLCSSFSSMQPRRPILGQAARPWTRTVRPRPTRALRAGPDDDGGGGGGRGGEAEGDEQVALPEEDWRAFRARLVAMERAGAGPAAGTAGPRAAGVAEVGASWAYESPLIEQGSVLLGGSKHLVGFGLNQQYFHKVQSGRGSGGRRTGRRGGVACQQC